jgi:hypothetical protein
MGLDVYLYKVTGDLNKIKAAEKTYEEESGKIYEDILSGKLKIGISTEIAKPGEEKQMTNQQREIYRGMCKRIAKRLGLNEDGEHPAREEISLNSSKYTEHMFKIGYFRSSYNSGGIDHILRDMVGMDLYSIFEPKERYEFIPDWKKARSITEEVLNKFKQRIEETGGVSTMEVTYGLSHNGINNVQDALEVWKKRYSEEKNRDKSFLGGSFSCKEGEFFMDKPIEVCAIMPGFKKGFIRAQEPCTYVIYKNKEGYKWYIEALEIVVETIDWVLKQKKPEQFLLHWSS